MLVPARLEDQLVEEVGAGERDAEVVAESRLQLAGELVAGLEGGRLRSAGQLGGGGTYGSRGARDGEESEGGGESDHCKECGLKERGLQ